MTREEKIMAAVQTLANEGVAFVKLYGKREVQLSDTTGISGLQAEPKIFIDGDFGRTDKVKFVNGYKLYSREYDSFKPCACTTNEEVPF